MNSDLIIPENLQVDGETLSATYAKFIAEPLERGYGTTLGNALKRILISSLKGAAIVAVKIEGLSKSREEIAGVKEDVKEIILNLKELRFRLHAKGPKTVQLTAKGPKVVNAKDIALGDDVEILNPDHVIASLSRGARLSMEMIVREGTGYVSAEKIKKIPFGAVPIDAMFSPVTKVNYTVTSSRVGQRTDYDKLLLEVSTDGSISPEEALSRAARILQEQLTVFLPTEEREEKKTEERLEKRPAEALLQAIDELGLSGRTVNALKEANINLIGDLARMSEQDLSAVKNCGQKCRAEVKETLNEMGLSLGGSSA